MNDERETRRERREERIRETRETTERTQLWRPSGHLRRLERRLAYVGLDSRVRVVPAYVRALRVGSQLEVRQYHAPCRTDGEGCGR